MMNYYQNGNDAFRLKLMIREKQDPLGEPESA